MNIQKIKDNFYQFVLNFLTATFLSHAFFKLSFNDWIYTEFNIYLKIENTLLDHYPFYLESPLFFILKKILFIENIDVYLLVVYLFFNFCIILICLNINFLGSYGPLFFFSGWLVTCSWFLGYVDIFSTLLLVIITKWIILDTRGILVWSILFTLLAFNHFGIFIFSIFSFLVLIKKSMRRKFLYSTIIGGLLASILKNVYLNYIGFAGRGRFRILFDQNIIDESTGFVSDYLPSLIWSGFLGCILILLLIIFDNEYKFSQKFVVTTFISLIGTGIVLDSSRIFSVLLVPTIIFLIFELKRYKFNKIYTERLLILSVILSTFIFQERHVFGYVRNISPNLDNESVYNFLARIINSLMKDIWI
tara:strand:+ start:6279 stop:7364 length:1086 start_codon:yes stop_codon:yes gene_type:complete